MTKSELLLFYRLICKYRTNYSFFVIQSSNIFDNNALYITKHLFFLLYDEFDTAFIAIFCGCSHDVDTFWQGCHIDGNKLIASIGKA